MCEFLSLDSRVKINIIDNNSSYAPLLDWYKNCPYNVIRMPENFGHQVFWNCNLYDKYVPKGDYYIISDSDLDLSKIPNDWLDVLIFGCKKYTHQKVGFSLKIDDVQDQEIVEWESQFNPPKAKCIGGLYYEAHIDTTFALHKVNDQSIYSSIRVGFPYTAIHVPWYYKDKNLTKDELYYYKTFKTSSFWGMKIKNLLGIKNYDDEIGNCVVDDLKCSGISIKSATYGGVNCTKELSQRIIDGRLFVRADNSIIGDPLVGVVKYLEITVNIKGIEYSYTYVEGSVVVLPKPATKKLGIFYSNNNNPLIYTAIEKSLDTIRIASKDKVDIVTCVWTPIPANPFYEIISWYKSQSHLNQLLQIMQCLYTAKEMGNYDYVSFLEHDVMYPEGYFDYDSFDSGNVITNMNYGGLTVSGWQNRNQDDEPFHQMTMRFEDAIKHCESILPNALKTNSGCVETQTLRILQWKSTNQAIHINHGVHFTSHNSIYSKDTYEVHDYWGHHSNYSKLFHN